MSEIVPGERENGGARYFKMVKSSRRIYHPRGDGVSLFDLPMYSAGGFRSINGRKIIAMGNIFILSNGNGAGLIGVI